MSNPKYIFCTGGVVSSVGKGVTAAAIGRILKARGLKVAVQKLDPYLNVDPGTMSPYQHGEVFVTVPDRKHQHINASFTGERQRPARDRSQSPNA